MERNGPLARTTSKRFIRPATLFVHDSYVLEPLESIDEKDIIVVSHCLEMVRMQAEEDRHPPRLPAEDRFPPPDVYRLSGYITSYPVFLSDRTLPLDSQSIPEGIEEIDRDIPNEGENTSVHEGSERDDADPSFTCIMEQYSDEEAVSKVNEAGEEVEVTPVHRESVGRASFMENGGHIFAFSVHETDNGSSPSGTSTTMTIVDTRRPSSPLLPRSPHLCVPMLPPIPSSLPSPPRLRSVRSLPMVVQRAVTKSGHEDWSYSNAHMY